MTKDQVLNVFLFSLKEQTNKREINKKEGVQSV